MLSMLGSASGSLQLPSSSATSSASGGRAGTGFKLDTGGVNVSLGGMGAAGMIAIGIIALLGIYLLVKRS
jgi:hypothetical protein